MEGENKASPNRQWCPAALFLDGERSWVDVFRALPLTPSEVRGGVVPAATHSTMLPGNVMGRGGQFPRFTKAYGEDTRARGAIILSLPLESVPAASSHSFVEGKGHGGALINYCDASSGDFIGPHSDDERRDPPRATSILPHLGDGGALPRFRLTPKKRKGRGRGARLVLDLSDGDVVVMGGDCQATHKRDHARRKTQPRERGGGG